MSDFEYFKSLLKSQEPKTDEEQHFKSVLKQRAAVKTEPSYYSFFKRQIDRERKLERWETDRAVQQLRAKYRL